MTKRVILEMLEDAACIILMFALAIFFISIAPM